MRKRIAITGLTNLGILAVYLTLGDYGRRNGGPRSGSHRRDRFRHQYTDGQECQLQADCQPVLHARRQKDAG